MALGREEKAAFQWTDRAVWGFAAVLAVLWPLSLPLLLFSLAPRFFEWLCLSYTGLSVGFLRENETGVAVNRIAETGYELVLRYYGVRVAAETLVRIYGFLWPSLALFAVAALLTAACRLAISRMPGRPARKAAATGLAFLAVFAAAGVVAGLNPAPAFGLAVCVATVFAVNFGREYTDGSAPGALVRPPQASFVAAILLPCVSHVFIPTPLVLFVFRSFRPSLSPKGRRIAVGVGRALTLALSYPVLILCFFAFQHRPMSAAAIPVLKEAELYDIEFDPPTRRTFVTVKRPPQIVVLDPNLKEVQRVALASEECEEIALDSARRRIYHVPRDNGLVWALDADSMAVVSEVKLPFLLSGSVKMALADEGRALFVSSENDLCFVVDAMSGRVARRLSRAGNVSLLADDANGVVYLCYDDQKILVAVGSNSPGERARVHCEAKSERPALSNRRHELYAPISRASEIWVYSTPDLRFLRKIPSRLGVRALGVDDERGRLFAASAIAGYLDVIDLETGKVVQSEYVGPYCRIARVDTENRRVLLTLRKEGLIALDY